MFYDVVVSTLIVHMLVNMFYAPKTLFNYSNSLENRNITSKIDNGDKMIGNTKKYWTTYSYNVSPKLLIVANFITLKYYSFSVKYK